MAASERYFVISLSIFFLISVCCLPEPGKKYLHFNENQTFDIFAKTMKKGYSVAMKGSCRGTDKKINIQWKLYVSQCAESFSFLKSSDQLYLASLWEDSHLQVSNHSLTGIKDTVDCNARIHLPDLTGKVEELIIPAPTEKTPKDDPKASSVGDGNPTEKTQEKSKSSKTQTSEDSKSAQDQALKKGQRRRREGNGDKADQVHEDTTDPEVEALLSEATTTTTKEEDTATPTSEIKTSKPSGKPVKKTSTDATEKSSNSSPKKKAKKTSSDDEKVKNQVCSTLRDGVFLLIVKAEPSVDDKDKDFDLTLNVKMKGQHGYLSASDWPLYQFYGCMSLLYVFYGIVWLFVCACHGRDLLRIQLWIGGVIALSTLEKAVFFSEYNNINITGETNPCLTVFAELVSCSKRTLARIFFIIVSMGPGIVKPRLGTTLYRVLGVGALYFILATVEGWFRSLNPKSDPSKQQLFASIPLALLDVSICCWIVVSLVQTRRILRIRRNAVKLSLYRHFTITLIFAVLASVAYMIWTIKTHRFAKDGCITNWSELWLDEAFWHILFSVVLLVIMVLWRPTANNQRYAFTPIFDFGDDDYDDDNTTLSHSFDGMKMINVKNTPEVIINDDTERKHKPEDDLKWVEENIPSSAADAVLPSVLDSDEELMTTD